MQNFKKDIDISVIAPGIQPEFEHPETRLVIVDVLRRQLPDLLICCYGNGWNVHPNNFPEVKEEALFDVIGRSRIGLDIQDVGSPFDTTMFEYLICGTPVITRARPEVSKIFKPDKEILTYSDYVDLRCKLCFYLDDGYSDLCRIAENGFKRYLSSHTIKYCSGEILTLINQLKGGE